MAWRYGPTESDERPAAPDKPRVIIAETVKGRESVMEGVASWHGVSKGEELIKRYGFAFCEPRCL